MREIIWLFVVGLTLLLLVLVGSVGYYVVQPYFIARETQTIRASNAFITSKQQAVMSLQSEYNRLEMEKRRLMSFPNGVETAKAIEGQQQGIQEQIVLERRLLMGGM